MALKRQPGRRDGDGDYLTVQDASRITGYSPSYLRLLDMKGELPAIRTAGGIRLFLRSDVEAFASRRELTNTLRG